MSRTIRRTRDKRRNKSGKSNFVTSWVFTRNEEYLDITAWRGMPEVMMVGQEYYKNFYKFHTCTNPGFGWGNGTYSRKHNENRCRTDNKAELLRWEKDNKHEVIPRYPRCLSKDR